MEAVIDPDSSVIVGFVYENAQLAGPWTGFITLPVPEGADTETLGVTKDGDEYVFCVDPTKVQAKTQAQWASVRAQQKELLYKSDWTCSVVDPPAPILAQRDQWIAYRAALRDVTTQSDPFNIVWPSPPVAN